jgi:hypothetical protein
MSELSQQVRDILMDCLFRDEELTDGQPPEGSVVIVEGLTQKFGFHKERLESHRIEVIELLDEMPDEFHTQKLEGKGGWSFLNLCNDRYGNQWGEHRNMEELLCLGIGLGLAHYCLPREAWSVLPAGMPYIAFATGNPRADIIKDHAEVLSQEP